MNILTASKLGVKQAPQVYGVYRFLDKNDKILYIGKANNLKSRLSSYYGGSLLTKTSQMVAEAKSISFIRVASEFEALLLEADLVKKYMPKYNSALKDDKSPLYIGITREEYPRVLSLRQTELKNFKLAKQYGPYVDSRSVTKILKKLQKIFPYSTHRPGKRACINNQIGLCDPCPSVIANTIDQKQKKELTILYKNNVKNIRKVLSRRIVSVRNGLLREMEALSRADKFEMAKLKHKQVLMLDYVTSEPVDTLMYLKNPNFIEDVHKQELKELTQIVYKYKNLKKIRRIECFDVAHLAGTNSTASMVTFINGEADKKFYRHFKIRNARKGDDYAAMSEVIGRRKKYFDSWGIPDLILVDGGKGQVGAFEEVLGEVIPVVGIAKRKETLVFNTEAGFVTEILPEGATKRLVQRIRNESHRFARRYHHKLVSKAIKNSH